VIPWERRRIVVGEWAITALSDGTLRLDGGSMWGAVPKVLWQEMTPAREDNTIPLALRPFLAERGDVKLVIEGGVGERWAEKAGSIYHIDRTTTLASSLRACGVEPGEVTHVAASHCHFDHIGGLTVVRDDVPRPLFPNAEHFMPSVEVEIARHPDGIRKHVYTFDDILPMEEAGLLRECGGGTEIVPGVRAHAAAGHSDDTLVITVNEDGEGETAVFWADVVPTTHHIQPAYIMAFDIDRIRSFESRARWLRRAEQEEWVGLFYHDAEHPFGRVRREGRRYEYDKIEGELLPPVVCST